MLVKNWMSRHVLTVDVSDAMADAVKLIKEHGIRMIPVMEKGELVGVVTDRDLKRASASDATSLEIHELLYLISRIKIGELMSRPPITVPLDFTVEETADVLLTHKISGVPVVDQKGKIVGVITESDLFRVLIALSGFGKKGIQFGLCVDDRPGSIKEVADILRSYGGRLASILTSYAQAPEGRRNVYIRTFGLDRKILGDLKAQVSQKAALLYLVDHRENIREVFDSAR